MCGILGNYNFDVSLQSLLLKQTHRGPDSMGFCDIKLPDGSILQLGHNRLKIICLSDLANQPLTDTAQQHYLVFNGEIYNYLQLRAELKEEGIEFRTTSDSEVLLQALIHWGMDALNKFNGMFAFAYFDVSTQSLYLARDRFGVKPLYYYANENQLIFASSSAPIAESLGLKPNYDYLKRGLQYGIYEDDSDVTAYQGLKSVRPGCYLAFSLYQLGRPKENPYYDLHERVANLKEDLFALNPNQLLDKVAEALQLSCMLRLKADVPVSIALSGGLDSSTVAVMAKQHSSDLTAFCFGSPDDLASEGVLAQKLASQHGIHTHFIEPNAHEWKDGFWQTLEHQDAPFAGLSVVAQFLLYQEIKKHGFKVVLGGQGGDEGFLGYRKFQLFYLRELIEKKAWLKALPFLAAFSQMLWAEKRRLFSFWQMRSKYAREQGQESALLLPGDAVDLNIGYSGDIQSRQIEDVLKYSLPTLLRYEDRNSMAHSIESRLPFMDYPLMELACALPVAMKLKKGYGKWALRELTQGMVPDDIRLARYKRGFDVTQSGHIYKGQMEQVQNKLQEKQTFFQSFLPNTALEHYFSAEQLQQSQQRFVELSTLLWLEKRS